MTASLVDSRLLDGSAARFDTHLAAFGPLPAADVIELAVSAGLTGRGGAGFPAARKLQSVADAARAGRHAPVVVGNAAEGEPAAGKDAVLLRSAPHLVLDGLQLVGLGLGADRVVLAAPAAQLPGLSLRLAERRDPLPVRLHATPDRFLAGEESALVAGLSGAAPLPTSKVPPIRERGVEGRPTLVQNVETLARLALLARGQDGAGWSALVTRHMELDGVPLVDVVDAPLDARLGRVLLVDERVQAVLVGGYHGTWLPAAVARDLALERESLGSVGASLGAGVLAALPAGRCGLAETARVMAYLAAESAGQCGPCLNGLPRIAAALGVLARPGGVRPQLLADVERWCGLVADRGACRHPDGSVRLVASALRVFAGEVSLHRAGRCSARTARAFLPVPAVAR